MRRLALGLALCAVALVSAAVPAAAVPIDPGRLHVQAWAWTSTSIAPAGAVDQLALVVHSPSELGDRPADGTQSTRFVKKTDLGRIDSFNRAIGAGTG